ncbi:gamma-glutamyl-hercynylcysteine sulfoxide hydrolase [Streptomyces ruber]|uniref:Gamma-glutamyl-hercynylcysteine sulfoxide hydrolase n=2 Tax=Streptomyces TaxID=1883 RepID=A0A918BDA1_9ACTN|nr:ergothioneine biosynthesis protein EgtC [Streptomyces ruber]GGQ60220.1 gamma-glutamyl-hercynylcysteine sulfoxide hydrolase [Streptomyces ruber]
MCRHLAYVGAEQPIGRLLSDPPHSLFRQSWAPRRQRYGTVNADGFGIGWYAQGDPVPARYRRSGPVWGDASFQDLARVVRTSALLGAVRDATVASPDGEAAAAPFAAGTWLFSHNGAVTGWPRSLAGLARDLPATELLSMEARSDSALVWALVLDRLRTGDGEGQALADTVLEVARAAPGSRLNLLLTDGATITATAWGDTLWYLAEPHRGVVVASEPYDDDPRWREVPDRTLLAASGTDVLLTPLKDPEDVHVDMASAPSSPPSPPSPPSPQEPSPKEPNA